MDHRAPSAGNFPVSTHKTGTKSHTGVLEIPANVTEINNSCVRHGIELSRFLMVTWSIVFSQFTEKELLYFGFVNLTGERKTKNTKEWNLIQAIIRPQSQLDSLFQSASTGLQLLTFNDQLPTWNTSLQLVQYDEKTGLGDWIETTKTENSDIILLTEVDNLSQLRTLRLVYRPSMISEFDTRNLVSTISRVIEKALENPSQQIQDLSLFSQENTEDVLKWNNKSWDSLEGLDSIEARIRLRAADQPKDLAICAWDGELTYHQLEYLTSKLAAYIRDVGVESNMMVPVTFEKSALAIIAQLAVMKAGAAFVPVDPALPSDRVKNMVGQVKACFGLASERYSHRLVSHIENVLTLSWEFLESLPPPPTNSIQYALPDDPAYVIFTSGSTGQPKGCVINRSALASVADQAAAAHVKRESRVLQFASFSFAACSVEIYYSLTMGATLCIPSDEDRLNRLPIIMCEMRVSWAFLTPSAASTIPGPQSVPSLKTLVFVGEAMWRHYYHVWGDKVQLCQALGCSEYSGMLCVSKPVEAPEDCEVVGPSPSANLWIVDPNNHNRPMPVGAVGELLIDGPALARGYLNDPVRTKSSFIERPQWIRDITDGMTTPVYKSGDLVKYAAGGSLIYVGRKDTQVKIRGQRVEMGEVEYQIREACDDVDYVVVEAAIPSKGNGSKIVVAFLYAEKYPHGTPPDTEFPALGDASEIFRAHVQKISEALVKSLPEYMHPSAYLPLRHVPKTLTGKADRKLLRDIILSFTRAQLDVYQSEESVIVEPRSEMEKRMHSMFSDILDINPSEFGVHDSFIRLGGDSVIAMRLANCCQLAGLPLSASVILEKRTVFQIASVLKDAEKDIEKPITSPHAKAPQDLSSQLVDSLGINLDLVEDVFPCSSIQQGMLLSQLRDEVLYQARITWEIRPQEAHAVDIERFKRAWRKLCSRHDMLRTQICTEFVQNNVYYQVVYKDTKNDVVITSETDVDLGRISACEQIHGTTYTRCPQLTLFTGSFPNIHAVLEINHMLMDGISLPIMMRDLEIFYDEYDAQFHRALGPVCKYHDYVSYLEGWNSESHLNFWRSRLSEVSPCIFPVLIDSQTVIPTQELRSHAVELEDLTIYERFCQSHDVTLASLFKMAWGLLLRCYTGSDSVCFGDSVSGRDACLDGIENAVGPYLQETICHIKFEERMPVSEMLRGIHSEFVDTLPHKHASLADIQHAIGVGVTRLFNTGLSLPPQFTNNAAHSPSIRITEVDRWSPTEYDVVLEVHLGAENAKGILKYWSQALDDKQAQRLGNSLRHILSQIVGNPGQLDYEVMTDGRSSTACKSQCIRDLQIISDQDLEDIWSWNGTIPESSNDCIHQIISERVKQSPTAEAVCAWDGSMTYRELDTLSTTFAHHLVSMNVRPGVIVPLCFEKSRWMPVAVLGVMKAGAASVALDITQPLERLQSITTQVQASVIVCSSSKHELARQTGVPKVCTLSQKTIDGLSRCLEKDLPIVRATELLYLVFTSGSTGVPKGVMISHQNFSSAVQHHQQAMGINSTSRVFDFVTYAFDIAWSNILHSMTAGACLCIPHEDDRHSNIAKAMNDMAVNYAFVTPTVARLLHPSETPHLRILLCGGELMTEADVRQWTPQVDLRNTYGPAECTVISNVQAVNPHRVGNPGLGKGRGCNLWIVHPESDGQLMPVGCTGELWIEGPIVGNGYLGDPEKTAATFINHVDWPACRDQSKRQWRLYKTGDLVRYDPNGNIVFVRRKDGQVKIRGQRVELGEVEYHSQHFLGDRIDCNVVAEVIQPAGSCNPMLVIFLTVGNVGDDSDAHTLEYSKSQSVLQNYTQGLLDRLRTELPSYMIPAAIIPLSRIPVTANGKTDRNKIRQIGTSFSLEQLAKLDPWRYEYRKPSTEMECALQRLWAANLNMAPQSIGARDSYLQIGGDSVGVMRMVGAARDQGLALTVAQVFQNPRLEDLALVTGVAEVKEDEIPPFSLLNPKFNATEAQASAARQCHVGFSHVEDLYPCTPLQEGLISLSSRNGDYINRSIMELKHDINLDHFQAAWEGVIAANPILRTRIVNLQEHGLLQAVIKDDMGVARKADLKSYLNEDADAPMGLGTCLARSALIGPTNEHDEPGHCYLVLTLHHAVYDAWSIPLLLDQVVALYNRQSPIPYPPFQQFIKHIVQNNQQASAYWESQLEGFTSGPFPSLPHATYQPRPDKTMTYTISGLQWPRGDITSSTVIRMAWSIITASYMNSPDVIFGAILSGRQIPVRGIEKITGPTIATVPVRVRFDWHMNVEDVLETVQQQAVEMIPYEQTGLQNIRKLNPQMAERTEFQSLLIIQPMAQDLQGHRHGQVFDQEHGERDRQSITGFNAFSSYALNLLCQIKEDGVDLLISYDSVVVEDAQVERLVKQFHHVLQQLSVKETHARPISEIGVASRQDIESIWTWNARVPEFSDRCVHEMISQKANEHPEATAVCAWDGSLSYKELDDLSDRLACRLRRLGVSTGVVMPLHVEKSVWMPVAQLAVMKTGAASVTLDISQPTERLISIIKQVQSSVIITSTTQDATEVLSSLPSSSIVHVNGAMLRGLPATQKSDLPIVDSSSPLYVVFTSGSTGTPKGVVITHKNISSAICHQKGKLALSPGSRVFDFASYAFDIAWFNFLKALISGQCLCIPSDTDRKNDIAGSMVRLRANFACLTASAARMIDPAEVPDLKTLVLAGETPTAADYLSWAKAVDLRNGYGPAECTPLSTATRPVTETSKPANIGFGMGLNTWIVDQSNVEKLAPLGAVGELWLEGSLVGQGYHLDSERTSAAFVENPPWLSQGSTRQPGRTGRLYRTGDLVRYEEDGSITFIGRKDAQVKIRGQRVELAEVEHHVRESISHVFCGSIAATVITPDGRKDPILVVFLSSESDASGSLPSTRPFTNDLVDSLAQKLPMYMIPRTFIPISRIPKTDSGKVDYRSLQAVGSTYSLEQLAEFNASREYREPVTNSERALQSLWATTLGVAAESISASDNFFAIGGDSIAAMQLVGTARDREKLSFTVADIFRHPRLDDLARKVQSVNQAEEVTPPFSLLRSDKTKARSFAAQQCGITPAEVDDIYPCTPLQEGMMSVTSRRPGDYINRNIFELRESVDITKLEKAWAVLIEENDIFRTRLVTFPGQCLMQVVVARAMPWSFSDNLNRYLDADRQNSMDLRAPLARFCLVQESGQRYLVVTMHHAIYDGWSMSLALEQMQKTYLREPKLRLYPFRDFIKSYAQSPSETTSFWQNQLDGIRAKVFPALPSANYQPQANRTLRYNISGLQWPSMNITPSTMLRAAWALLTAQYHPPSDEETKEVLFGATVTGRQGRTQGIEKIVGPTIATVPIRVQLPKGITIRAFLEGIQHQAVEMIEFEHTGLQNIRRISQDADHATRFQNLLVVQPELFGGHNGDNSIFKPASKEIVTNYLTMLKSFSSYSMMLLCQLRPDGVELISTFDSEVIAEGQVERLSQQMEHVLRQLCNQQPGQIEQSIEHIDTLSPQDRTDIWKWNSLVPVSSIEDVSVAAAILNRAVMCPDALAVSSWDGELSYSELDETSTKIAHVLTDVGPGVRCGDIVALHFEKSRWMPVFMVALMKLGAVALQLSSSMTQTRIDAIFSSVSPRMMLTNIAGILPTNTATFAASQVIEDAHKLKPIPLPTRNDPDALTNIIFTSGTSRLPKGILWTQRALAANVKALSTLNLSPTDRVFQFASYDFDVSIIETYTTLVKGACLCIPSETERLNSLGLTIARFQASWVCLTPSTSSMIEPGAVTSLTTCVFAGEALSKTTFDIWSQFVTIFNWYGPAECSTAVSCQATEHPTVWQSGMIGSPLASSCWIVDPSNSDCLLPVGATGELLLGGLPMMTDYVQGSGSSDHFVTPRWLESRFSDRSTESLMPKQYAPVDTSAGRLYRTGDLVRYQSDGLIIYVGRKDTQVKIRGQRVELSEIDAYLNQNIPASLNVSLAAEVIKPVSTDPLLVAFIATNEVPSAEIGQFMHGLREKIAEQLPRHMLPAAYIQIGCLPLTTNGKINRSKLREIGSSYTIEQLAALNATKDEYRKPTSITELALQKLWAVVIGVTPGSARDNFLLVGGDSIAAMRLVSAAREEGFAITVADVFKHPRLEDLAEHMQPAESFEQVIEPFSLLPRSITATQAKIQAAHLCAVTVAQVENVYPCTSLQEGMMSLTVRRSGDYVNHSIIELHNHVNFTRLVKAWQAVIQSTPILRTRIVDLPDHGLFQAVVIQEEHIKLYSQDVDSYLSSDKEIEMGLGTSLARFGLIADRESQRRFLALTLHHSIYDGWCFPLVLDAVQREYYGNEPKPTLLSFDHFIKYSTHKENSPDIESFWNSQFLGIEADAFPSLPSPEYQPQADETYQHNMSGITWPKTGITPSSIIRTAWTILTARYQQTTDVIFGATVTGRQAPIPGIEKIIGPTIATVPIRIKFQWDDMVPALLGKVQEQAVSMVDFEQTGLQKIQQLSPQAERATKFQTLLVVQPVSYDRKTTGECEDLFVPLTQEQKAKGIAVYNSFSSYAILLLCQLKPNGDAELIFSFDSSVVDLTQVQRISQQMDHIIRQLCTEDVRQVCQVETASPRDLQDIWTWNSRIPVIDEVSVPELISRCASRCPERPAIDAWDGKMTYAEMDQTSTDLARRLERFGVCQGDIIALHFMKSMWMPVTMVAIMKLGAVVLPLSESQTTVRMDTIFSILRPRFVITNIVHSPNGAITTYNIFDILRGGTIHDTRATEIALLNLEGPKDLQAPAHILFTSGSSGIPKGIVWHHKSLTANIQTLIKSFKMTSQTRVFQFVSYDFDVSNMETYATLASGACLCIPSEADRINQLSATMKHFEATWVFLTPSASEMLDPAIVPSLHTIVFGGEKLSTMNIERFLKHAAVLNWYGPGEAAASTLCVIDPKTWTPGLIGPPLASSLWIVDPTNPEVILPVGATGELLIYSPSMMSDYVKGTVSNTDHFIKPKWLAHGTAKDLQEVQLYRSGDLVRYRSDGSLVYIGRKDAQVKIRGQRVELSDIESHIRSSLMQNNMNIPAVADIILPRQSDNPLLVAFIAIGHSANGTLKDIHRSLSPFMHELREQLAKTLPRHMLPGAYIPVDCIPLTSNGKVNRASLRATGASYTLEELAAFNPNRGKVQCEPTSTMEFTLRELWASTLKINASSISTRDSFLQIGGDSIAAMRLVGAARQHGLLLAVTDVFKYPRLDELAQCVKSATSDPDDECIKPFSLLPRSVGVEEALSEAAEQCGVSSAEIRDIYPCTPLQEGLLAITNIRPGQYVSYTIRKLRPNVDLQYIKMALRDMVNSLPVLRTRIVDLPSMGLVQVVLSSGSVEWSESHDVNSFYRDQSLEPMALGTALSRFVFVKQNGENYLGWSIHHALYDGWSMPLMLEQLKALYFGMKIPPLAPFSRFIKYLASNQAGSSDFWQSQLGDSEAAPFPALPSVSYQPHADQIVQLSLRNIHWPANDITASTLVRAAWALLTAQYSNSCDTIFGATMTGRQVPVAGVEKMAGPTITTVPVRIAIPWSASVDAYLRKVQKQMVDMIPYEQTGLQNIRRISSEIDQASQFQTLLVVQPASENTRDSLEDQIFEFSREEEFDRRISSLTSFTSYAVMLMCHLDKNGMDVSISFDSKVIPAAQIQRMGKHLEHCVRVLSSERSAEFCLRDLDLLSEKDLDTIWTWNAALPPAEERPIYDIIFDSASSYSDSCAIDAWDGKMTYAELDRVSSELASRLVALGARPSMTIPLHFEKSMWMPVSILAVLKTGASFVQLSTALSIERIESILQLTCPSFALVSSDQHGHLSNLLPTYTVSYLLDNTSSSVIFHSPAYSPESISNILFTSGSTGVPKGIMWSHRALSTNIRDAGKALSISRGSRVFQFAAYDFDVSILESLGSLLHGACLCIPSEDERRNRLVESINKYSITLAFLTPSVSEILSPESIPTLQTVVFGGEALSIQTVAKWADHVTVKNYYGPAECSSASNCTVDPNTWVIGGIGFPSAVVFWVADPSDHDRLVPVGAIGELMVEGPTLSSGFINRGSGDVFVHPKWLSEGSGKRSGRHGRVYKTGDLVRQDVDGSFIYVGRKDDQVKIRGQRVELGEVEYHVRQNLRDGSGVHVVAEVMTPLNGPKAILIAFIAIGDAANDEEEARSRIGHHTQGLVHELASKLPAYMIPNAFIPIDAIPTTATSKVDRRRLREIGGRFSLERLKRLNNTDRNERRKPTNATECIIQQLWASLLCLDHDSISLDDNFLVLGGDSIKAMQFVRAAHEHNLDLAVTDLFLHPRLSDLASIADEKINKDQSYDLTSLFAATKQQLSEADVLPSVGLSRDDLLDAFPVSDFQRFYVSALMENTVEKFAHCYIDLPTGLNVAGVVENCRKLWDHLDILRIVFIEVNNTPVQALFRGFAPVIDVHRVEGDLVVASEQSYRADFDCRYEPGRPVTRFIITHTESGQIRLALRLSHAQFDGLSLSCFMSTFTSLSNGQIPPPNPSFSNYIAHLMETRGQGDHHWRSLLQGSQVSWPKTSLKHGSVCHENGHQAAILLSKCVPAPQGYKEYTPSTVFTTICARVIARLTSSDDVVFGYLTTGRPCLSPQLQEMAGPCVNIVPLRVSMPQHDFGNALSAVHTQRVAGFSRDSDQLSDIVRNCTDWPLNTEHFGFGVHFLNIEDQLENKISATDAQIVPFTVKPAITFPTIIMVARPRADGQWLVEVRGGGGFHSQKDLELILMELVSEIAKTE